MGDRRPVGDVQPFAELFRSSTTVVYKGYQQSLDRFVLLKRLESDANRDDRVARRFKNEARLVARLQHPNVVAIYAYGEDEVSAYLIAEYVDGVDLAELVSRGGMPVELAVYVLRETVRGIGAAHDRGIVHQDIKPSNILVSFEGQVKVADFGMASVAEETIDGGEVRGTLPYLAPEQIRGAAATPSTDLFSLGATFFEMIMGRRAFLGSSSAEIFESILHYDPVPLLAARTSVPAEVIGICGKLLSRSPDERFESWREVEMEASQFLDALPYRVGASALSEWIEEPSSYVPPRIDMPAESEIDSPASGARRSKSIISLPAVFGVLGVVVAALIVGSILFDRSQRVGEADHVPSELAESAQYPIWLYPQNDSAAMAAEVATESSTEDEERLRERIVPDIRQESGWLRIQADPWAVVVLDDDTLGRTPLASPVLRREGRYRLTFLHPDFPAYQREVDIAAGETAEVSISLWDLVGQIRLEVSPWAAVSINGTPRDTIPPQSQPYVLRPGNHRLQLHHPELGEYETTFNVEAGESTTLRYNLIELLLQ